MERSVELNRECLPFRYHGEIPEGCDSPTLKCDLNIAFRPPLHGQPRKIVAMQKALHFISGKFFASDVRYTNICIVTARVEIFPITDSNFEWAIFCLGYVLFGWAT
jgi:hypothetical protein